MQTLRRANSGGIQLPNDVQAVGYRQVRPYDWRHVFKSASAGFEGTELEFVAAGHAYEFMAGDFKRVITSGRA